MACSTEFNDLDEELKELLLNYKNKQITIYEPCTKNNFKECLIGLREELGLLNINYIFNPYMDIEDEKMSLDATVHLINNFWTLLQHHKTSLEKVDRLNERNNTLENNNKTLDKMIANLKSKSDKKSNDINTYVSSMKRLSDHADKVLSDYTNTKAELQRLSKVKKSTEKTKMVEISRLCSENQKLMDKVRKGLTITHEEECDLNISNLKAKYTKQKEIISQLQIQNHELLREVLNLKEELLIGGLSSVQMKENE